MGRCWRNYKALLRLLQPLSSGTPLLVPLSLVTLRDKSWLLHCLVPGLRAPSERRHPPVTLMGALPSLPAARDSPLRCLVESGCGCCLCCSCHVCRALAVTFFLRKLSGHSKNAVPCAEEKQETSFSMPLQHLVPLAAIRVGSHGEFLL